MKIAADNDHLFIKRQDKQDQQFIESGANSSPFFVVLDKGTTAYQNGDIVLPRLDRLIPIEIDRQERFFINAGDVLGKVDEAD